MVRGTLRSIRILLCALWVLWSIVRCRGRSRRLRSIVRVRSRALLIFLLRRWCRSRRGRVLGRTRMVSRVWRERRLVFRWFRVFPVWRRCRLILALVRFRRLLALIALPIRRMRILRSLTRLMVWTLFPLAYRSSTLVPFMLRKRRLMIRVRSLWKRRLRVPWVVLVVVNLFLRGRLRVLGTRVVVLLGPANAILVLRISLFRVFRKAPRFRKWSRPMTLPKIILGLFGVTLFALRRRSFVERLCRTVPLIVRLRDTTFSRVSRVAYLLVASVSVLARFAFLRMTYFPLRRMSSFLTRIVRMKGLLLRLRGTSVGKRLLRRLFTVDLLRLRLIRVLWQRVDGRVEKIGH